jgi:hypothetical protein
MRFEVHILNEEYGHLGATRLARKDLIVTVDGQYHGAATEAARASRTHL